MLYFFANFNGLLSGPYNDRSTVLNVAIGRWRKWEGSEAMSRYSTSNLVQHPIIIWCSLFGVLSGKEWMEGTNMHAKFRDFVVDYWDRYRALRYLFMVDSNYREDVNRRARLWCVQRGFASNKVHLYGFPKTDYRDYVSDFQQYLASKINRPYSILLSDKSVFAKIHGLTELSPRVYGRISCGKIFFQASFLFC